jgi:hypothetical protein
LLDLQQLILLNRCDIQLLGDIFAIHNRCGTFDLKGDFGQTLALVGRQDLGQIAFSILGQFLHGGTHGVEVNPTATTTAATLLVVVATLISHVFKSLLTLFILGVVRLLKLLFLFVSEFEFLLHRFAANQHCRRTSKTAHHAAGPAAHEATHGTHAARATARTATTWTTTAGATLAATTTAAATTATLLATSIATATVALGLLGINRLDK